MNKILTSIRKNVLLISIFAILALVRFIWVDTFPPGMQYDEIEYSLSSKTFQMMATDLSGVGFPESLITTRTLGKISPVPIMLLSPVWYFVDLTIASFRSLYVILNIITAGVFIYFLTVLFKNKYIAWLGGILFLLNPWSFFLSRHGMDGSFALVFYMLGSIFLLKTYSKKNIFISLGFFLLGFFSYHGAKLPLVPLVTIISGYKIFTEKLKGKQLVPYIFIIIFLMLTVASFVFGGKLSSGSILDQRSHEFVFTNAEKFSSNVNLVRKNSIESPLSNILINKIIFAAQYFMQNYVQAFSPILLFLQAEVLEIHGFFYIFELVLLIIGFMALFAKQRKIFWLLLCLTLIAPISTATSMSGFSVINRGILLLPLLLTFITYGLYEVFQIVSKYVPKFIATFVIIGAYVCSFVFFQFTYFFILPIQINMHYQMNTRILAKYLSIERNNASKIIIMGSKPQVLFSGIVFYLPREEQEKILKERQTFSNNEEFTIGNITITPNCVTKYDPANTYIVDHDKDNCLTNAKVSNLVINQKDAGVDYSIIGGKSCKPFKLTRWRSPHLVSDFHIEDMNTEQFCTRWIASP